MDNQQDGRVGKPTGLSQAEPQEGLGPTGFDPSRVEQEAPPVQYDPFVDLAQRVSLAGAEARERIAHLEEALSTVAVNASRIAAAAFSGDRLDALSALAFISRLAINGTRPGTAIGLWERGRDSDGSPEGGDGEAGSCAATTARAEGIAETPAAPHNG